MTTPYRGKGSKFFVMHPAAAAPDVPDPVNPMNLEMNPEQWNFIFKHYPEYGTAPYDMMTWLFGMALANEEMYSKPASGGEIAGDDEPVESSSSKYDGFGGKNKQGNKESQRK